MVFEFENFEQFYYTIAAISATWVGLVFVAMTIWLSDLKASFEALPSQLSRNAQFPYYLINLAIVDLITLAIPLLIKAKILAILVLLIILFFTLTTYINLFRINFFYFTKNNWIY
jgi:hypothetical protein